jgi:hypothetical protein
MPRSTTPRDGRNARNEDRIGRLIRIRISEEIDTLVGERQRYLRVCRDMSDSLLEGQLEYYDSMISALRRLEQRFRPNRVKHVPQESRDGV